MDAKPYLIEIGRHLKKVRLKAVLEILERTLEENERQQARKASGRQERK
ncbi:MAG: hypothetical protein HY048_05835 [Acidobacteria bacterium]|nr:hypothetical protein [Acidobacteriota bacterium]